MATLRGSLVIPSLPPSPNRSQQVIRSPSVHSQPQNLIGPMQGLLIAPVAHH